MTKRAAISIGSVLEDILKKRGLHKKYLYDKAIRVWGELAGPSIASHTKAERIEQGRLFISVDNASMRQELHFEKLALIDKLNRALGGKVIKEIVLR